MYFIIMINDILDFFYTVVYFYFFPFTFFVFLIYIFSVNVYVVLEENPKTLSFDDASL